MSLGNELTINDCFMFALWEMFIFVRVKNYLNLVSSVHRAHQTNKALITCVHRHHAFCQVTCDNLCFFGTVLLMIYEVN